MAGARAAMEDARAAGLLGLAVRLSTGWALLGRGRLGAYVVAAVLRNAAFAGSYLFIQFIAGRHSLTFFPSMVPESLDAHSGWQSIVWAYSISGLVAAALAFGLLKRLYAFRLNLQNWVLIVASCALMPVLFSANTAAGIGLKFGALALWLLIALRREEWKGALQWLRDLPGRTKR